MSKDLKLMAVDDVGFSIDDTNQSESSNGGGGNMGDLSERVKALEQNVAVIETKIDGLATKAELEKGLGDLRTEMAKGFGDLRTEMHSLGRQMAMWSVTTILAAAAIVFAIMRFFPPSAL